MIQTAVHNAQARVVVASLKGLPNVQLPTTVQSPSNEIDASVKFGNIKPNAQKQKRRIIATKRVRFTSVNQHRHAMRAVLRLGRQYHIIIL
jgi:hypothetical protein